MPRNTQPEIETAMNDFRLGKFGRLPPLDGGADSNASAQAEVGTGAI
jgi:hypothetical protein